MALAGDHHIVIAVIAHFAGLTGLTRRNGTANRQRVALAFLAAKTTTHAAHFTADRIHRHAQSISDLVLDFGGVLGRAVHNHIPAFLGQGEGCLAF